MPNPEVLASALLRAVVLALLLVKSTMLAVARVAFSAAASVSSSRSSIFVAFGSWQWRPSRRSTSGAIVS